ncbi:MAG: chemotaxis protein CheW [Campylobacterales bacterium]|nr:chemotaxis protein CheW [Campylobacterales bacterium]
MNNTEAILRQRAIAAAKRVESTEWEDGIDVITFRIGNEHYAIESDVVNEVHASMKLTLVPYTPSYIQGIFYMRGRFISVIDLKHFLGMETQSDEVLGSLLLLHNGEMEFAVAVNDVQEQTKLSKKTLQLPSGFDLPRTDLMIGVSEEGVILLNGKKLLSDSAMRIHQEVVPLYKGGENV